MNNVYSKSGIVIEVNNLTFKKTLNFLDKINSNVVYNILQKYAKQGADALAKATPVRTGLTARSWGYEVTKNTNGYSISWFNANVMDHTSIVALIVLGHATGTGGYVPPNDFVTPTIRPILEKIVGDAWEEVSSVT